MKKKDVVNKKVVQMKKNKVDPKVKKMESIDRFMSRRNRTEENKREGLYKFTQPREQHSLAAGTRELKGVQDQNGVVMHPLAMKKEKEAKAKQKKRRMQ